MALARRSGRANVEVAAAFAARDPRPKGVNAVSVPVPSQPSSRPGSPSPAGSNPASPGPASTFRPVPAGPDQAPPIPGSPGQRRAVPSGGGHARLRQFAWASVPVLSISLLAFAPFLRLAIARRTAKDWAVFAGYLAAVVVEAVLVPSTEGGWRDDVSGALIFLVMGVAAIHAFIAFRPAAEAASAEASAAFLAPSEQAVASARQRLRRRQKARELARDNPVLARELRIGRPDIPHDYDDGGLVDVNHVPGEVLASSLGLTQQEAAAVAAARAAIGRFTGTDEMTLYAQLPPQRLDDVRDLMMFG